MRRKLVILLAALAVISATTVTAFASQPHLSSKISTSSGSLIAEVQAAGLGSGTAVYFELEGIGTGTAICRNPQGKEVPGKKAVSVDVTATSDLVFADAGGSASVTLETNPPGFPSPKAVGCPNGFTVSVFTVDWTGAIVTLFASDRSTILDRNTYACNTTDTSTGTVIKCKSS
jgi:hypothetical protein